jgi:hypothetical protein
MFRRVRDEVVNLTKGSQEPFTYGSLPGEGFYFKPGTARPIATPVVRPVAPDRDEIVWAGIAGSKEAADFAFYLRQFPAGKHVAAAKAKLAALTAERARPSVVDPRDGELVSDAAGIKDAQTRLYELNYEPGPADGEMGQNTRDAIKDFQTDVNLTADGKLTRGLHKRLRKAGSLKPWGAIVYRPQTGDWGMVWGLSTRADAVKAAQKTCNGACDKELTFFKGWCGAFAHAADGWALSSRQGMRTARFQARGKCRILAAVCSGGSGKFVAAD